jgi:hypothetical protein
VSHGTITHHSPSAALKAARAIALSACFPFLDAGLKHDSLCEKNHKVNRG